MTKIAILVTISVLCVGYGFGSIFPFQAIAVARTIKAPKSIDNCYAPLKLDNSTVETATVLATVKDKSKTFYALHPRMADTDPDEFGPLVSVDSQGRCDLLTSNDKDKDYFPLNKYVKQAVVRNLYLAAYKDWILEKGKANVNNVIAQRRYFDPDQVWALKKMNLQLPSKYQVCAPGSQTCQK
jgi:hypothetical protein